MPLQLEKGDTLMPVKTQNEKLLCDVKKAKSHKVKAKTLRINKRFK